MLFHERAKIAKEMLEKQPEYTYQEMLEITQKVKAQAKAKNKKTGITVDEEKSLYNLAFVKKYFVPKKVKTEQK